MDKYEEMNTRELLALYRRTKSYLSYSDVYEEEQSKEIEEDIFAMKGVLNKREHIPTKAEAKKIRQEKARNK